MHFKLVNFKSYNFLDMFLDIARNARYARKKFSSRFYISPWAWSVGFGPLIKTCFVLPPGPRVKIDFCFSDPRQNQCKLRFSEEKQ